MSFEDKDKSNKRRATGPAIDDRTGVDMDQLKSFIVDQNKELQDTINKTIQDAIENNNKANIQSLESILDKKLDIFSGYVDSKIESVRTDCMATMEDISNNMNDKISKINNEMEDRIDYLERQTKLCDVVIKNIPYRQDENMENLVYDICDAIVFKNTGAIKSAFRLSRYENRSNPIIMKFYEIADKRDFMEAYFHHPLLNLTDVGFKTKQRIVICEALTRKNNEIFRKAMNLKFNKIFSSVSTKNGFVFYRLEHKSRPVKILSISSLDAFHSTGGKENDTQRTSIHHANYNDTTNTPVTTTKSPIPGAISKNIGGPNESVVLMEAGNISTPKDKNTDDN